MKKQVMILTMLLLSAVVWGQGFNVNTLMKIAESGDREAQYEVGMYYDQGLWGVPKDEEIAKIWFRKAADNGYVPAYWEAYSAEEYLKKVQEGVAKNNAGCLYEMALIYGHREERELCGITRDWDKYREYLVLAADRGYAEAEYVLADNYCYGICGFNKDKSKAHSYFRRAAQDGHVEAMAILGFMYYLGEGCRKDDEEALEWYYKAADLLSERAMAFLYFFFEDENRPMAIYWLKLSQDLAWAKSGKLDDDDTKRLRKMGVMYHPVENPNNIFMQCRYNPDLHK